MAAVVNKWDKEQALELTAAAAIAVGQVVYVDTDGKFNLADANASGTRVPFGVAVTKAAIGEKCTATKFADISGLSPGGSTPAAGDRVYLDTTAGGITKTVNTTNTESCVSVGILLSATRCVFALATAPPLIAQTAGTSNVGIG